MLRGKSQPCRFSYKFAKKYTEASVVDIDLEDGFSSACFAEVFFV
jgi:hypothetical protein